MASIESRVPENVRGRFYVDTSCIYCGLCDKTAPTVFRECQEQGWAYVFHQPETAEELRQCMEAVEGCPTASIGADDMSDKVPELPGGQNGYRWIWLVVAIIAFGVLMAARTEFHSRWLRAGLAACAFGILGGCISWFRRARR